MQCCSWRLFAPSYTHWAINHLHQIAGCLERTDPRDAWRWTLCIRHCYTVLYNVCILLLSTRYTYVICCSITLRIGTLYAVVYNNVSITKSIT